MNEEQLIAYHFPQCIFLNLSEGQKMT